ncbi:MAG TPA: carboxypeptidase-like regulatory domain-containing protein, partial [Pyrinomonadaceae bacterium]|nr:carboxypeptidase-like regulatory domain-containing protein [Pyrinomonadaceae bacterium]
NLRPGKYQVTASLDGYKTQETEVEILPQKTVGISLELDPIKYQLQINTNIRDGEIRFAPAKLEKSGSEGIVTKETGGYCIVKIQNNKAVIPDLNEGYYNIDIRPSGVEYQTQFTAINIPEDLPDDNTPFGINLEKKISTETFASAWTRNDWVLPAGWSLNGKMETKNLAGIALPRNEQYRYYTDFEMVSDVRSLDGKSIGFVLRAEDPQNYYLVQISGANAAEPYRVTGFIVRDGKQEQIFSNFIQHFSSTIAAKKPFRVIIKGEENVFKTFIEDSETGDRRELGNIIDRDKNFRKGAVGISGFGNSNFEVGFFTVCAKSCR